MLAVLTGLGSVAAAEPLALRDCAKCHASIVRAYANDGLGHAENHTCMACHPTHRPEAPRAIPGCDGCHPPEQQPHYAYSRCLCCHNPHTPRDAVLIEPTTEYCVDCHPEVGEAMAAAPSYHSGIDCAGCHERHREVPHCVDCHGGHEELLGATSCNKCHRHHTPVPVRYGMETPSTLCAACHPEPLIQLDRSASRHAELTCAFCHREPHGTLPECTVCHGEPHGNRIHSRHEQCIHCHFGAHALAL